VSTGRRELSYGSARDDVEWAEASATEAD
jgi:hypothetical protein